MTGILEGFTTIAMVVAVGWLLARFGMLGEEAQRVLSLVAFWVCSPALLLAVLQRTPLDQVLSANLAASAVTVALMATTYLLVAPRLDPGGSRADRVIGALCASYVNAGNLGLPIATYVLGDPAWIAPVLLLQLLVITPVAMTLLDREASGQRPAFAASLVSLVRNPITVGAALGLVLALTRLTLPRPLGAAVDMLGQMAVPAMLLAFGVSLRAGPRPGLAGSRHVMTLVALKVAAMPVIACVVGLVMDVRGTALLALVVASALPTAQNIFTYAVRYDRAVPLARDVIFFSTFASLGAILVVATGFHALGAA